MRIERAVSLYHLRIGQVETHVLCYHTLARHATVSSNLPFLFTLHYQGTGQTKFRKLLHKVYPPVRRMAVQRVRRGQLRLARRTCPGSQGGKTATTESA